MWQKLNSGECYPAVLTDSRTFLIVYVYGSNQHNKNDNKFVNKSGILQKLFIVNTQFW